MTPHTVHDTIDLKNEQVVVLEIVLTDFGAYNSVITSLGFSGIVE